MKKLLIILAVLLVCGTARAELDLGIENLNLPDIKGGAIYLLDGDSDIEAATMATILKYEIPKTKLKLDLDAIYVIENTVGAGVALEIGSLANITGIELALANIIDLSVGVAAVYDFNAEDYGWGIYGTAIKVKF